VSKQCSNQALITYSDDESRSSIDVVVQGETIWATQRAIAELFDVGVPAISKHLKTIFETKELEENQVISILAITAKDGKTSSIQHYSLDAVISIGYRVNSKKATQFRRWATSIIGQYIKDGYIIDEKRLREDPAKLNKLAAKIRELRANEKNVYASVRECFKLAASDYEPSSNEVKSFFALLQDKFHHAVTRMTSSKLILDRANHAEPNMGLESFENTFPTLKEAKIGKNYLREKELYRLHLLSEQFLLYAETTALRGESMTMVQLHKQLDNLLVLNGYPLFDGYQDFLKPVAMDHAECEYKSFIQIEKLKMLGINVDLEDFYNGEYSEQLEQAEYLSPREMTRIAKERKNLSTAN
jgi:hypothetical protein